ncbi:MAG: radical SAM protein, partial [Deltaproteobacteria bacterium]|nr:radical SAM protein [Deltaproteobacteria bacterium]
MGLLTLRRFTRNAVRARFTGNRVMDPIVATYHVTSYCNLDCVYCEDFGQRKNRGMKNAFLGLEDAKKVLRVIRTATENLILTGGETLLHPAIDDLTAYASEIGFKGIALITNGVLLPKHESVLAHLTRLIISLDSLDGVAWDRILASRVGTAERIIGVVRRYAALQGDYGFKMIVNCVVMPDTIGMAREVIDFCVKHDVGFSLSPQGLRDQPHAELLEKPEYRRLVEDVLRMKEAGYDAVGSRVYLKHILNFEEFQCYPTLNIRVMQNGDFIYPCRPIADRSDGRGGVAANLLEFDDFREAFTHAVRKYGQPPKGCRSCFQQ